MILARTATRMRKLHHDRAGHAAPALADLAPATGAPLLGAGAAAGEDVLTIIGAIALAVGILGRGLIQHITIEYAIYDRLNALESNEPSGSRD